MRQKELVDMLEKEKVINTIQIAAHFGVSVETIRRDLDQLEAQGILKKIYGGAELRSPESILPLPLESRRMLQYNAKAAIASRAAEYISDDSSVALDAGSTIFELCKCLHDKKDLIIISADIHSAGELLSSGHRKVYMMGGFLTPDGASGGTFSKDFFNSISSIDFFVTSTDGATPEDGLSTDEEGINNLKKCYLKKATKSIAMIDHTKFRKKGFYKLCDFSEIDLVITDSLTPSDVLDKIRESGPAVDIVSARTRPDDCNSTI